MSRFSDAVEGMDNNSVRALCHLLLLKRSVDGLNGRNWEASKHLDYEDSISNTLAVMGLGNCDVPTLNATKPEREL